jgi:2-polyprenyl-6-methoxyphenol hydroxylase-like FAD-dependent oxidoreductase
VIGEHAAVLGGSLAGLAGAAVLARRFERVTVVERDRLPRTIRHRKGVPQGRHVHVLLPGGLEGLAAVFPGVLEDLREQGADVFDARALRFNIAGGSLLLEDVDVEFIAATRPLIEGIARDRVRSLTNVRFVEGFDAFGLTMTPDRTRVTGARLRSRTAQGEEEAVEADLVMDATGRGSHSPRWLAAHGYPVPSEERIHVGVHYTTRLFGRARETAGDWRNVAVAIPPGERRGAVALAVEGDRWIVTLIGILGERPPTDLAGFVEYARTLWTRDVHAVIADAPAIGEASTGAFPANVRRRYDRLRRFPDRYIVTGDAACSLNPVYAQGMSVAFGEALTLAQVLDHHGLDRVGPRFFRETKPITGAAWTMATGADLGHPGVQGPRTVRWRLLNAYIGRAFGVAHRDPVVAEAALKVLGMVNAPQHLLHPRIASRVFTGGRLHGLPINDRAPERAPMSTRTDSSGRASVAARHWDAAHSPASEEKSWPRHR